VSRAAADHQPDLAGPRPGAGDQGAIGTLDRLDVGGMGLDHAVEHFLDDIVGVVEEFLDMGPVIAGQGDRVVDPRALRQLLVELRHAVGIEDAAAGGGVGDQHIDIAAAQAGQYRRHLVEAAGHRDAQAYGLQHIQRYADRPVVEWAGHRMALAVDEAAGDDAHRVPGEILLQRNGFEEAAGVDGRVRA